VFALLIPAASIGQQVANQHSAPSASGSAQVERDKPATSAPPATAVSGMQASSEAKKTCDEPGDETDKECQDLRAQQDMAKWARLMYFVSGLGVAVSTIVAGFVVATFKQTRRAAKAAEDSVRDARESAEKQLRAYLWREASPSNFFKRLDDRVTTAFSVKNSGQTPAHDVQCWCKFELIDAKILDAFHFEEAPKELTSAKFVINPGSEHTFGAYRILTDYEWSFAYVGQSVLVIWGEIRYMDVFKALQKTRFRLKLRIDHEGETDNYIWEYCDKGNDTT
jgi:hypothetical protein